MVGYTTLENKAASQEDSLPNVGDVHQHDLAHLYEPRHDKKLTSFKQTLSTTHLNYDIFWSMLIT